MKIGVISDSFNALGGAAGDEADGLLPGPADLSILDDDPAGTDEGRAMAQIIHAAAPEAAIDFYSGGAGATAIANGIDALAADGCRIIVDDLSLPHEPFFQLGTPIDNAIDRFVANGGTYLTSAGNAGQQSALQGHWQGTGTRLQGIGRVQAMNFGTTDAPAVLETLQLQGGSSTQLTLQWNQPWRSLSGEGSDYSLAIALYRPDGTLLRTASVDRVGRDPVQTLTITPAETGAYQVAIYANGGADPGQTFKLIANNNSTDPVAFPDARGSGSIYGHALDPRAIAVGATDPAGSGLRAYSSSGPGVLLRGAAGHAIAPVHLQKGHFTAPDGESTSVASLSTFDGTSASAALAAGWAGALLEADPDLTRRQIRAALRQEAEADAVEGTAEASADRIAMSRSLLLGSSAPDDGPASVTDSLGPVSGLDDTAPGPLGSADSWAAVGVAQSQWCVAPVGRG